MFGTLDQSGRHVLMKDLAQQPLALAAPLLQGTRQSPGEFNHAMVQKRDAGLQAHRHGSSIHLHQNVIRQIRHEILMHHPRQQAG